MAVGHMISWQVWISTKDFHKIKPVENSNLEQGRGGYSGKESPFCGECLLAYFHVPVDDDLSTLVI